MSVKELPSGKFAAYWYVRRKRKQRTFMSRRVAEDWLAKKRLEKEKDEVYGRDNKIPVLGLIRQYMDEVHKSAASIVRDTLIRARMENWLAEKGVKLVSQVTKGTLAEYEEYRRKDAVCQRTINIDLKWINAVLNHAWKRDRIAYNPAARYPYKSDKAVFSRYLTLDEINKILDVSGEWYTLIYALLTMGLRAEEACFLEFSDYRDGLIHIRPKKVKIGSETVSWAPKWGRERWVSLTEDYANDKFLQSFFTSKNKGLCFVPTMTRDAIYHRVKRIVAKSKIDNPEDISPHILRHTHISYMVARAGKSKHISLRSIMENVGIGDYQTLMRYSQAVRNLAKNIPDPDRLPWQK